MTVKTDDSRGDIYKNDKNAELRCSPEPIDLIFVPIFDRKGISVQIERNKTF